jgi:hypothetical protein
MRTGTKAVAKTIASLICDQAASSPTPSAPFAVAKLLGRHEGDEDDRDEDGEEERGGDDRRLVRLLIGGGIARRGRKRRMLAARLLG